MLLAIDIGNTQTVLGLYDGHNLRGTWRISTIKTNTADELAIRLQGLFDLDDLSFSLIDNVAIASVVPELILQWQLASKRFSKNDAWILSSQSDIGLDIKYENPSEIGADRLADCIAAIQLYGAPVLVVDFGTATNIEVVDKDGAFMGGVIAPGLATSAEALFSAAARLSRFSIDVPNKVIGTTTKTAVQSGLSYGEVDRIDGLIKRIFDELGYSTHVVATGGLSDRVVRLSKYVEVINDNLTIEGLRIIHERLYGEK